MRFLIYLLLVGVILYFLSIIGKRQKYGEEMKELPGKGGGRWFRPKKNPREVWIQVYETATLDEARILQARLEEEELECVVYEQGKKDIQGNPLKGIGIAVPRSHAPRAQGIISRMPV